MTDTKSPSSEDRYAHLRANAATQRQTTIDRLREAIAMLEAEQRPVNTFGIVRHSHSSNSTAPICVKSGKRSTQNSPLHIARLNRRQTERKKLFMQ